MSVSVELERLQQEMVAYGSRPYLLTVTGQHRPHAVSVSVGWDGDVIVMSVGSRTAANVGERPEVTLLWPPPEPGGYTLIVDGEATATSAGDGIEVRPTGAVLHRAAAATEAGDGYRSDCVPIVKH